MSPFNEHHTPGTTLRGTTPRAELEESRQTVGVRECRLGEAVSRRFVCEEACAFWERGGAVAPAGCLLDRVPLDLARQPEAARLLAALKERLERSESAQDRRDANAQLSALVDRA